MNESCHTLHRSHSKWRCVNRMSHVTHINEACHTYECAMSHIWMSHVTCIQEPLQAETYQPNKSCYTSKRGVSLIWMGHVTHMNESCHTCTGATLGGDNLSNTLTYIYIHIQTRIHTQQPLKSLLFIRVTWLIHIWQHLHQKLSDHTMWHDSEQKPLQSIRIDMYTYIHIYMYYIYNYVYIYMYI